MGAGASLFDSMTSSRKADSSCVRASGVGAPVTMNGCGAEVAVQRTLLFLLVVLMVFIASAKLVATNFMSSEEEFLVMAAFKSLAASIKISSFDPPGIVYLSGKYAT